MRLSDLHPQLSACIIEQFDRYTTKKSRDYRAFNNQVAECLFHLHANAVTAETFQHLLNSKLRELSTSFAQFKSYPAPVSGEWDFSVGVEYFPE